MAFIGSEVSMDASAASILRSACDHRRQEMTHEMTHHPRGSYVDPLVEKTLSQLVENTLANLKMKLVAIPFICTAMWACKWRFTCTAMFARDWMNFSMVVKSSCTASISRLQGSDSPTSESLGAHCRAIACARIPSFIEPR